MYEVLLLVIAWSHQKGGGAASQLAAVLYGTVPYQFFEYAYIVLVRVQYSTVLVQYMCTGGGSTGGCPRWLNENKGGPQGGFPPGLMKI